MASGARIRIIRVIQADNVGLQMMPRINNLTFAIAGRMQRLVPKKTFRLRDTIAAQPAKNVGGVVTGSVTFGGKVVRGKLVDYHLMVERGTSRMRAQPFARPALYQSRSRDLSGHGA